MSTVASVVELGVLFALYMAVAIVVSRLVPGEKAEPADWPPPVVWDAPALDRLLTAVRADPWGPPDAADLVHTYIWTPAPEWDHVTWLFSRPPHPWTRVA